MLMWAAERLEGQGQSPGKPKIRCTWAPTHHLSRTRPKAAGEAMAQELGFEVAAAAGVRRSRRVDYSAQCLSLKILPAPITPISANTAALEHLG